MVRYLLDNFASVNEAVAALHDVQVVPVPIGKKSKIFGLHFAIEDKTGDSAIIEFIDGNLVIHHGREYTVMTNDPPYNVQIENLDRYEAFGGEDPLPGNIEADERFVGLQYFSQYLPETRDHDKAVAYMLSVMRTVAAPFGAPYAGGDEGSVAGSTQPTGCRSQISRTASTTSTG